MSPNSNSLDQAGRQMGNFLSYLTRRQQIIASNIANADTPGYKTKDVTLPADFSSALTEAGAVTDAPGLQTRNDGNNVSIDREARLLAENTMKFNLATQLVKAQLKNIRAAIEEGHSA